MDECGGVTTSARADETQKEKLAELGSKDGRVDLYNYSHKVGRSALEVLRDFPAARPGLDYLMELIPPLRPHLFSISSAPSPAPHRLTITAGIVAYKNKTLMERKGVCTSFLKTRALFPAHLGSSAGQEHAVPLWLKQGSLRIPPRKFATASQVTAQQQGGGGDGGRGVEADLMFADVARLETPLIMVGQGTVLAPLRSSVSRRVLIRGILFFGCRTESSDFLYRAELEGLVASGDLRYLGVAYSCDQTNKIYVQDKVREAGRRVWEALESGGVIMVSDSSEKMPQSVREAFVSVVDEQAQEGREYAEAYVKHLETQSRYLQDTRS